MMDSGHENHRYYSVHHTVHVWLKPVCSQTRFILLIGTTKK